MTLQWRVEPPYLLVKDEVCTCGGGNPYPHEPICGWGIAARLDELDGALRLGLPLVNPDAYAADCYEWIAQHVVGSAAYYVSVETAKIIAGQVLINLALAAQQSLKGRES